MKAVVLGGDYFQQDLNIDTFNNFYLSFPNDGMGIMKNQIKGGIGSGNLNIVCNTPLPNKIHQVILGSLLGDMHCRRECLNSNIQETHSINQKDYLTWKYSILKDYFNLCLYELNNPICKAKNKIYFRKKEIRLRSRVSKELNIYHELFYETGKKAINKDILNQVDTFGLAIWYCDDGYYDPENHTVELHTEGFLIEGNKIIKDWFKERWDMNVNFKKDYSKKKILLRFPVKESEKFLGLIKDHIFDMPQSMWYKLGHLWEGNLEVINKAKLNKSRRTKLYQGREEVRIKCKQKADEFYCKNKDKFFQRTKEYRKTEKYRNYIKEYVRRPEVKERRKEREKIYRQNLEYKKKRAVYQKEYRKRPGIKEKVKEYNQRAREKRERGDQN